MKIHHITIPAQDPQHVARILAELLGARVAPMPHPPGCLLVHAGDPDGTAIEVWPAALRAGAGDKELVPRDLPLPASWPHHAFITSEVADVDRILSTFAREGWRAERVHNGGPGGGFGLVRGWIENQTTIELGGLEMRQQYERTCAAMADHAEQVR